MLGRSLMNNANRSGDNTEPYGTDDSGLISLDFAPYTHTIGFLSLRNVPSALIRHYISLMEILEVLKVKLYDISYRMLLPCL